MILHDGDEKIEHGDEMPTPSNSERLLNREFYDIVDCLILFSIGTVYSV